MSTSLGYAYGFHNSVAGQLADPTRTAPPPDAPAVTHPLASGTATAGDAPAFAPASLPPSIDRYRLGAEIARGGMGAVYRATDVVFGREVAVKVLADRYAPDSGAARRFLDEARITGQLQHLGIPPVHDLGALPDGRPFLAMKLIKGDTLDDLLKHRPHPAADRGRFVAAFEKVCEAVAYAHSHHVLHRDLKPANVMVGSFGEVQVMDWGLAKVLGGGRLPPESVTDPDATTPGTVIHSLRDSDGSETQAGSVLGTPAFMPPEQAVGAVGKVDARSDVSGLGAILAVILTGKPPFAASSAETTRVKAAQGDVDDCFARLDGCGADPDLVALCKRCLSPKPEGRPADAGEVAAEVAALRTAADERARRAEIDREKAEVRRVEERRRARARRTLILAGSIPLGVAIGALAFVQKIAADRDRIEGERSAAELRQQLEGSRRAARNEEAVAALLDRCEETLRATDTPRPALALDAADKRAADGLGDALTARLARGRADLAVSRDLDDLDDLDQFRWTLDESEKNRELVSERCRAAFARYADLPEVRATPELTARVRGSAVRDRLVVNLDRHLRNSGEKRVHELLREVDPHPFRGAVRDVLLRHDGDALRELAASAVAEVQPTEFLAFLGETVAVPVARRQTLLRVALARKPNDLGLLMAMGGAYETNLPPTAAARVRWYQAAAAVDPVNPGALHNLGNGLTDAGDLAGAVWAYRRASDCAPENAWPHIGLGNVYALQGDADAAAAEADAAARLAARGQPHVLSLAYNLLGVTRRDRGDQGGTEEAFRRALALDPKSPWALLNMGRLRLDAGDADGALPHLESSLAQNGRIAQTHNSIGYALYTNGEWDQAVECYQRAAALDPTSAYPPFNAGLAFIAKGDFDRTTAAFEAAQARRPKLPGAGLYLHQIREWKALAPRLPQYVAGEAEPRSAAEAVAELCRQPFQKRYRAAVRFYRVALRDPQQAEVRTPDGNPVVRYNAACAAVLAVGAGKNEDPPNGPRCTPRPAAGCGQTWPPTAATWRAGPRPPRSPGGWPRGSRTEIS